MSSAASDRKYFYGIDAIRFAAALMVVLFHLGRSINSVGSRGYPISQGKLESSISDYVSWGSVGVEIFFVISGLVIANSANGSSAFHFIRSRAERLYPAVWICATLSFLAWTLNGATSFRGDLIAYLHSLTLVPIGKWIDAPYWTLGHEIVFYGCVWLMLLAGQIRHMEKLAIGITIITAIHWGGRAVQQLSGVHVPFVGLMETGILRMFFTMYGGYFAFGIFLWIYFNARLSCAGWVFALLALVCCLAPYTLSFLRSFHVSQGMITWLLGTGAIILSSYFPSAKSHEGRFRRYLRNLGLATFPLYLVHYAVGGYVMRKLVEQGITVDSALAITVIALILLSLFIATQAEPLIRKGLRMVFNRIQASHSILGRAASAMSKPNSGVPVR